MMNLWESLEEIKLIYPSLKVLQKSNLLEMFPSSYFTLKLHTESQG